MSSNKSVHHDTIVMICKVIIVISLIGGAFYSGGKLQSSNVYSSEKLQKVEEIVYKQAEYNKQSSKDLREAVSTVKTTVEKMEIIVTIIRDDITTLKKDLKDIQKKYYEIEAKTK